MTPGNLLKNSQTRLLLAPEPTRWDWVKAEEGHLFCLDSMDMTQEWAAVVVPVASAAAQPAARWSPVLAAATALGRTCRCAAVATDPNCGAWKNYDNIYNLALKEFEETGKIRGYKFLTPDGKNTVWLSHYDVEFLKEQNG